MQVESIMKQAVISVTPDETIRSAMFKLIQHKIRHLPVISESGDLVGILSDRDLREAAPSKLNFLEEDFEVLNSPVSKIMKRDLITCHPQDFIDDVAHIFYERRIGCLPVIQQGKMVGIVTETDILHTLVELMGVNQPSSQIIIEVPDQSGVLADVATVFKEQHVNVSSVLVYPDRKSNTKKLAFRVRTMDPRKSLDQIQKLGYNIVWPIMVDEDE